MKNEVKEKILKKHPYKITEGKNGRWSTYLPNATPDGKRKQLRKPTLEQLQEAIIDYYVQKTKQESRNMMTLDKLFHEWTLHRRDCTAIANNTLKHNCSNWKNYFQGTYFAEIPVNKVTAKDIRLYFELLTKDRKHTHRTITNFKSILSGMLTYAVEEELIEHNPIFDVDFRKFPCRIEDNNIENVFKTYEVKRLLAYLENIHEAYSLAIQLDFNLILRVGELKALKWEDIDFKKKTVYIHSQALEDYALNDDLSSCPKTRHTETYIKGKTHHGFRTQPLNKNAIKILQQAKKLNPFGEYVFMPFGKIMITDTFNKRLKKYCNEANITYHSSHNIRFYTASKAFNGKNLAQLSKMMGHSNTQTTLHYLRNIDNCTDYNEMFDSLAL